MIMYVRDQICWVYLSAPWNYARFVGFSFYHLYVSYFVMYGFTAFATQYVISVSFLQVVAFGASIYLCIVIHSIF